ncbi:hypothetical protein AYI68_g6196 [Smittium mucronatum]|uniref:Clathrin light chain n=1 Tax=Smittium mucronatum TaxID=133383 RepID=A0A1R0GS70_9FUNG|nr:hypothetical protein AYI68_g6196 [Smittium mucronatum]
MAEEYEKNLLKMERDLLGDDADMFQSPSMASTSDFGNFEGPSSTAAVPAATPSIDGFNAFEVGNLAENFKSLKSPQNNMDIEYLPKTYQVPETSEFLNQWEIKIKEVISERDRESEEKAKRTQEKATADLDKFYDDYNEKKKQMMVENEANQEGQYQHINSGSLWEQVSRQIGLVNKSLEIQDNFIHKTEQKDQSISGTNPIGGYPGQRSNIAQKEPAPSFDGSEIMVSLISDFASGIGPKMTA